MLPKRSSFSVLAKDLAPIDESRRCFGVPHHDIGRRGSQPAISNPRSDRLLLDRFARVGVKLVGRGAGLSGRGKGGLGGLGDDLSFRLLEALLELDDALADVAPDLGEAAAEDEQA